MGGRDREAAHAGRLDGGDSRGGILEADYLGGVHPEPAAGKSIALGMGLPLATSSATTRVEKWPSKPRAASFASAPTRRADVTTASATRRRCSRWTSSTAPVTTPNGTACSAS